MYTWKNKIPVSVCTVEFCNQKLVIRIDIQNINNCVYV